MNVINWLRRFLGQGSETSRTVKTRRTRSRWNLAANRWHDRESFRPGIEQLEQRLTPAITFNQLIGNSTVANSGVLSIAVTVPTGGVAVGHTIIGELVVDASGTIASISDGTANTYSADLIETNSTGNGAKAVIFSSRRIGTAIPAGNMITVTFTAKPKAAALSVDDFTGIAAATPQTSGAVSSTANTAPNSGNVTTTQPQELLLGAIGYDGIGAFTTETGWTNPTGVGLPLTATHQGITASLAPEYLISTGSGTGPFAATGTIATAANWAADLATYQAALATPTLTTASSATSVTLGTTAPTLKDSAILSGGVNPTGTITFTLFVGSTLVDTETATVSGNGTYTTPTGFTLPTTGTVTGTYQWNASYNGDTNNNSVSDNNAANEQVMVSAASPTLTTTPGQTVIALGTSTVTLTDTAQLSLGYHPTGTITFILVYNGGTVDTETVAVSGNGSYTTPTGYTLKITGGVTGTYQWNASYSGDTNNNTASDINDPNEQVTISKAGPTITTTPSPKTVTLGPSPVTLRDTADIEGGSNPTGTITFTLVAPGGGTVDTETVAFSGNGMYTTPTGFTLPITGTVTGTYQWNASYSGDNNDDPAISNNDPNERVVVSAAIPTISTTANPSAAAAGTTLQDSAALSGDAPTGSITFNLYAPGINPSVGTAAYTETVTGVNGNGIYSTLVGFAATTLGTWHWVATYNGDANNNSVSSVTLSEPVTVSAAQADLQITKTDGKPSAVPGTSDAYTIVVTNAGPGSVTGATVMDPFPANFTGVTWTATATGGATSFTASGSGNINDTVTMPAGSTITYVATGTISPSATGTLSNTATVTPPAGVTDPNLNNNSATNTDTLTPQNDISVTKVDNKGGSSIIPSTGVVVPGTSFTYTITVSNSGPSTATNVSVSDPVPSGLSSFVWSGNGHTNVSGAISDTIASLAPGASVVYTVAATANPSATGTISNAVTVNAANDTNPNNNSATDDIDILTPQNDVSVTKTDNKGGSSITPSTGTVAPGNSITYTITVSNSSPSTATSVSVSDPVPSGLSSFVWSGNGHTNISGAINDIITSLAPGASVVYTVTATVGPSATGTLANTATVSAANDTNTANNSATVTDNLTPQNDVSVTKTDNKGGSSITASTGTVVPGTSFTYTITVSNSGPSTATNVAVSDPFPAGIASDIWTGSNGSSGTGALTDTIASLAPGASVIYTVAALVDPSATAQLVNMVTVTAANDTNTGNNTATDRDNLTPQNDVSVTKVSNSGGSSILGVTGFVVAGSTFTYTITVSNSGPSTATNVSVSDPVPTGLTSFVWSGNGHTNVSGAIIDTITSLAPGASVVYTVTATVDPAATGQISNTVTVTAANDTNPSNNSATDTENVESQPIVTVSKVDNQGGSSITGSTGTVVPGTSFTYTITVSNGGASTATNVSVTDPVPTGLTSFVWSGNGHSNVSGAISDTIATLAPSTSVVYTVTATASPSATGQITNTVTATESGVEAIASDTDLLTPQNDVSVTKTDNKGGSSSIPSTGAVAPGTGLIYTITVSNSGPSTATNVRVTDPVPTGLTSFVWSGNGQSNVSGAISDTIASLARDASVVYTVTATVSPSATGTLSNTVIVVAANDTNTANNTATDSDTLTPQNDVSVTKTDNKGGSSITPSTGTVVPGTGLIYTITVNNSGPSTATSVSVSDPVPTGLTSFVWSGNGQSNVSGAISDTITTLAPGASVVYTVTATVDPAATGTLSNTATVSAANDTNNNNNSATVTDNLTPQADLSIVKTNGTTTAVPGSNITYDITVTNNGPSNVTGATVSDMLPAGTTFVSATNGATYNSGTNTVNFAAGTLASNGTNSFQLTLAISSTLTGTLSNTATVTPPAGVTDPIPGNNSSTATDPLIPQADLQITKTDGNTTAVPGTSNTYTIVVTNAGPSSVTGARVMDTFPVVFTGVTWTATATGGATGFTASGSGNINDTVSMPVGSTITYMATGIISPSAIGALINDATVAPPAGVTDPNLSNNSAGDADTLTPQKDVSVTKTDNKGGSSITPSTGTVVPGTSFTYTITVSNSGPSTATDVSVSDPVPSGLTSFVWSGNGHTNVSGAISDTIASLLPGASVVYTVTATVRPSATGTLSNTATVRDANDTNTANDSATVTDNLTPQADLSMFKTSGVTTAVPGNTITYNITVTNNGPSTMTGATVSDVLPAGTSFVSATNGATYDSGTNTVSFTTGTLATGGTDDFRLTLAINLADTGTLSNTATVAPPAGVTDPNSGNNSSTDTVTLTPPADLSIFKTDGGGGSAVPGANVIYTITVTNNGPSTMTGAQVIDVLPAGTTFVSATNGATYNSGTHTISFTTGTLANGGTTSFQSTLAISPSDTGSLVNTAIVAPPAGFFDPNLSNNSFSDTIALTPQADLSIVKTPSGGVVVPGSNVTYTITVTNSGPSSVTGAMVSDVLPGGTTFVSATNGATYNSGTNTVSYTTGTVGPTGTGSFQLTLAISPTLTGSTLSNTAMVTPPTGVTDPNLGNNSSTATNTLGLSTLTGFVYQDLNNNAVKDPGEPGIPNTTVTLTGTNYLGNPVSVTTMTDSNGQYMFPNLLPSNRSGYTITETQPTGFLNGKEMPPSNNFSGTIAAGSYVGINPGQFSDIYQSIIIAPGSMLTGSNYNFGEALLTNTVPPAQTVSAGTAILFCNGTPTQLSVNAPNPLDLMRVTLSLTPGTGTLTMASTIGLTFTAGANGTALMTFQGTVNAVNSGLAHLTYMPAQYFSGTTTLTMTSQALDPAGNPLPGVTDTDAVLITVTGVNHPPTVQAPATQTTHVNTPLVFSSGSGNAIVLGDPDVNPAVQIEQLTLTAVNGKVTLATTAGLTFVSGNGTGSVTIKGTINALNAAVLGLSFTPTANFSGTAYLLVSLNDLGNTGGTALQTGKTIIISVA